jgi:hypothetical protein
MATDKDSLFAAAARRRTSEPFVKDNDFVQSLIARDLLGASWREAASPGTLSDSAPGQLDEKRLLRSSSKCREGSDASDIALYYTWVSAGSLDTPGALREDHGISYVPSLPFLKEDAAPIVMHMRRATLISDMIISQDTAADVGLDWRPQQVRELGIGASGEDSFLSAQEFADMDTDTDTDTDSDGDGDWRLTETPERECLNDFLRLDHPSLFYPPKSPPNPPPRSKKAVQFAKEHEECETWNKEDYARGWTDAEQKEMQETALKRVAAEAKIIADENNAAFPEAGPMLFGGMLNLKDYWGLTR